MAQRFQKRDLRFLVSISLDNGARVFAAEQLFLAFLQIELMFVGRMQTERFGVAEAELTDEAHQNGFGYPEGTA